MMCPRCFWDLIDEPDGTFRRVRCAGCRVVVLVADMAGWQIEVGEAMRGYR